MTNSRTIRIRLVTAALAVAALLVPVTVAPGGDASMRVTEAGAGTTCCLELGSNCEGDGDPMINYYAADSCPDRNEE